MFSQFSPIFGYVYGQGQIPSSGSSLPIGTSFNASNWFGPAILTPGAVYSLVGPWPTAAVINPTTGIVTGIPAGGPYAGIGYKIVVPNGASANSSKFTWTVPNTSTIVSFEAIAAGATSTGILITNEYYASTGLTFPDGTKVYNTNTDGVSPPSPAQPGGRKGYVVLPDGVKDITVDPARNFSTMIADIGVGSQAIQMEEFTSTGQIIGAYKSLFSNPGLGWVSGFTVTDPSVAGGFGPIGRITVDNPNGFYFFLSYLIFS